MKWAAQRLGLLALLLVLMAGAAVAAGGQNGIGLQVVPVADGRLVVLQVVPYSPADRAGLRPGDLLLRVGQRPLKGTDLGTLSRQTLWGEPGTTITLDYLRPGTAGRHQVTLQREALSQVPPAPPGVQLLTPDPRQQEDEQ